MQTTETQLITSTRTPLKIDFGLIFFSSNEAPAEQEKYRLVLESARFADQHGFSSIWIPERHFTQEGRLYPSPAILHAALATQTQHIQLRSGSVVLPLHNPIQIAEEWAMIDNLSGGRVGISFASGWHPHDFVLNPDNYVQRNAAMYTGIEIVQKLWRGEAILARAGNGEMAQIRTYPSPLQRELPIWITAAGNPKTFATAGEIGANLLTHMYNQSIEELAEKIRIYRTARAQHGYDPATGQVSVMLHTFVGTEEETVRQQLQGPFCKYLRSATHLLDAIAYSRGQKVDLSTLSSEELNEYLLFVFDRLISNRRVLFGTPESCLDLVIQLQACGVNEIACQMDFGVKTDLVLRSLPNLVHLKEQANIFIRNLEQSTSALETKLPSEIQTHVALQSSLPTTTSELARIQQRCREYLAPAKLYQQLEQCGVQLSGTYQTIRDIWYTTDEALGLINTSTHDDAANSLYQLPPALFDTCCLLLLATLPSGIDNTVQSLYLPSGIDDLYIHQATPQRLWSHAQLTTPLTGKSEQTIIGDITLYADGGTRIAEIRGLQLQRIEPTATPARPTTSALELNNLLYSLQWEEMSPSHRLTATHKSSIATWLIFADQQGVSAQLATHLQKQGGHCVLVTKGDAFAHLSTNHYQVQAQSSTDLQSLFDEQKTTQFDHILHLWSLDLPSQETLTADELLAVQETNLGSALHIIQATSTQNSTHLPKLWLLTQGTQPVIADDTLPTISQASIWGLGKTCAMEYPELWGGLIDLDPLATPEESAICLLEHIHPTQQENQLAFRHNHSYAARLVRTVSLPASSPLTIHEEASYLITGGLSGLGLATAHWLIDQGARHLILFGRTQLQSSDNDSYLPSSETRKAALQALEKRGARIHYVAVDIANIDLLQAAFTDLKVQNIPPLRGILHAASVWQDRDGQSLVRPLATISTRDLHEVLRPKVGGAWNLIQIFKQVPLDFFVSFSSGASLLGSASQGNYAAASEFLDIFARYQRLQGQHALSIDWGAIADVGFGATSEGQHIHSYWEARGIQRLAPQVVFEALEHLIPQEASRIGVMQMDWALLAQSYPHLATFPLIKHLLHTSEERLSNTAIGQTLSSTKLPLQQVLEAPLWQRHQLIADYLNLQIANVLQLPQHQLDHEQSLAAFGLDSLMALELKHQLDFQFTIHIPVVALLQGPSIAQLATHILTQIAKKEPIQSTETMVNPVIITADTTTINADPPLTQQEQEHILIQLDQRAQQNVAELVQNLLSTTQQATSEDSINQQQASQLDQLTDEQIELLLQQIASGGNKA